MTSADQDVSGSVRWRYAGWWYPWWLGSSGLNPWSDGAQEMHLKKQMCEMCKWKENTWQQWKVSDLSLKSRQCLQEFHTTKLLKYKNCEDLIIFCNLGIRKFLAKIKAVSKFNIKLLKKNLCNPGSVITFNSTLLQTALWIHTSISNRSTFTICTSNVDGLTAFCGESDLLSIACWEEELGLREERLKLCRWGRWSYLKFDVTVKGIHETKLIHKFRKVYRYNVGQSKIFGHQYMILVNNQPTCISNILVNNI